MKKMGLAAVGLVAVVQLFAIITLDWHLVVGATGVAVAGVLLAAWWRLAHPATDPAADAAAGDPGESLRRWLDRTETLIAWSESSRSDWDRRLRPVLARQFELAAGQRKTKDPRAFNATGRMLFGEQLWQWVDPENVARAGGHEPGPGRDTLNDILQRLEQL